mmetsp:Transcript_91528/g.262128  ORF Transcript_91528/g.262128 Transcript_91528/m.262128 type:complete len:598 (+) Transcript_91528:400-2193(+)
MQHRAMLENLRNHRRPRDLRIAVGQHGQGVPELSDPIQGHVVCQDLEEVRAQAQRVPPSVVPPHHHHVVQLGHRSDAAGVWIEPSVIHVDRYLVASLDLTRLLEGGGPQDVHHEGLGVLRRAAARREVEARSAASGALRQLLGCGVQRGDRLAHEQEVRYLSNALQVPPVLRHWVCALRLQRSEQSCRRRRCRSLEEVREPELEDLQRVQGLGAVEVATAHPQSSMDETSRVRLLGGRQEPPNDLLNGPLRKASVLGLVTLSGVHVLEDLIDDAQRVWAQAVVDEMDVLVVLVRISEGQHVRNRVHLDEEPDAPAHQVGRQLAERLGDAADHVLGLGKLTQTQERALRRELPRPALPEGAGGRGHEGVRARRGLRGLQRRLVLGVQPDVPVDAVRHGPTQLDAGLADLRAVIESLQEGAVEEVGHPTDGELRKAAQDPLDDEPDTSCRHDVGLVSRVRECAACLGCPSFDRALDVGDLHPLQDAANQSDGRVVVRRRLCWRAARGREADEGVVRLLQLLAEGSLEGLVHHQIHVRVVHQCDADLPHQRQAAGPRLGGPRRHRKPSPGRSPGASATVAAAAAEAGAVASEGISRLPAS